MSKRGYVRIDRDDGSRKYVGPLALGRCQREATAWKESFPLYIVTIMESLPEVRQDVRQYDRATKLDGYGRQARYFPQSEGTN